MTQIPIQPGITKVTSLITLCDGHPRVVGHIPSRNEPTSTFNMTWTNTKPTFAFGSYPTAAPCSISPEDCELWNSWTTHYTAMTNHQDGLLDPPCSTKALSQTYSTNDGGGECDNCLIIGHKIRLLYWPAATKARGDLCNKTAETSTASPTGNGLTTFVTEGITITSPSVAISIGGLSRIDKCGTPVAHTIIPVPPDDVSSVNGACALFTLKPFNFADLNSKCLSDPDAIYVTTKAHQDDCYQEVPGSAYFFGYAHAAGADWYMPNASANSTIWPNYQPQVLPPETMTEAIRSLWGSDCYIHPDGIWDPPVALGQVGSIPLPEYGPGAPTQYTAPTLTPAIPGAPTLQHASLTDGQPTTAVPELGPWTGSRPNVVSANDRQSSPTAPQVVDRTGGTINVQHSTILTFGPVEGSSESGEGSNGRTEVSEANLATPTFKISSHDPYSHHHAIGDYIWNAFDPSKPSEPTVETMSSPMRSSIAASSSHDRTMDAQAQSTSDPSTSASVGTRSISTNCLHRLLWACLTALAF